MTQRKLTDFEIVKLGLLLEDLDRAAETIGCNDARQYFFDAVEMLSNMRTHGTTDGKPRIEPQPEIGEGYRLATEADKNRRDLEFWSRIGGGWQHRKTIHGTPLDPDYHYRVPVDRIPTDEDAKQRPTVMVRDYETAEWKARSLLAVTDRSFPFITGGSGYDSAPWRLCRFPYPGELD
jgi:hypothetical protein